MMVQRINEDLKEFGLTFAQACILVFLIENKENSINQRDIEKKFNLSNPTVNGILNRLESKKIIKRINNDADKRIKNIVLLNKADDFYQKFQQKKKEIDESTIRNISEEEMNIFYIVVDKMLENVKEKKYERNT